MFIFFELRSLINPSPSVDVPFVPFAYKQLIELLVEKLSATISLNGFVTLRPTPPSLKNFFINRFGSSSRS